MNRKEKINYIRENIERVLKSEHDINRVYHSIEEVVDIIEFLTTVNDRYGKLTDAGKRKLTKKFKWVEKFPYSDDSDVESD